MLSVAKMLNLYWSTEFAMFQGQLDKGARILNAGTHNDYDDS